MRKWADSNLPPFHIYISYYMIHLIYLLSLLFWKVFKNIDFERVNEADYESLKKKGWIGFAEFYLHLCIKESQSDDQIDIHAYTKLVDLDAKFGTKALEQLILCMEWTTRSDVIKVWIVEYSLRLLKIVGFKDKFSLLTLMKWTNMNTYEKMDILALRSST